jgi:glucose-fructose oxidoreductase
METRWGTFIEPWTFQPQPRCGFVLVGNDGTIASWDYDGHVTVQTRARPEPTPVPVDPLPPRSRNPIEHLLGCLVRGVKPSGPLDPGLSLTAQRIVDTASQSAREKRTPALLP